METISRLTQLYSDTKTSCDAVVEQDTKDTRPETNALHRKFRIQKDRLITWGVDWSDNSKGTQGDIDESVDQAGLTETVTSVLGTIRDISDEAERLRTGATVGKTLSGEKRPAASDVPSWAAADRSRYEDLIKDLTTSIDILYDLSRTRRAQRTSSRNPSPNPKAGAGTPRPTTTPVYLSAGYSASDLTLVNPATFPLNAHANVAARSSLPPKLNQSDLSLPEEEPPPYESVGTSSIRVIGRLRTRHSSTNPWKTDGGRSTETPVLVEYATYDPTYRHTGVSPPTDRLERLLAILPKLSNNPTFHGTLKCLGYYEDVNQPRFGLVYELPTSVYSGPSDSHKSVDDLRPVTLLSVLQTGSKQQHSSNSATPPLEERFRLAFTLALTFSKIHGDNFVHKDLNSSNVLVFKKSKRQSANTRALQYTLRSPVICSFDLFSEYDIDRAPSTIPMANYYRHPQDPLVTEVKDASYSPHFDMYSLGLILLEVGLWQPLSDLWKQKYTLSDFKRRIEDVYIRKLASKCGTAYMQVVRDCFWAADGADGLQDSSELYNRVLTRLQRCCMLDESEPGFDINDLRPGVTPVQTASTLKRKSVSQPQIASEVPSSPSYRSAKRWAMEKGSQALERTRSLSKPSPMKSPDLSLTRNPSQRSTHSIRKSISESLRIMSPSQEAVEPEWEDRDPLEESGTLIDTPPNSQDRSDVASLSKERVVTAASIIQRAWRKSRAESSVRDATLRSYKEKITLIQKAWRESKQKRTNTIEALLTDGIRHWPQATLGYPTPEPEVVRSMEQTNPGVTHSIHIVTDSEPVARPKLRLFPAAFAPAIVQEWHTNMLPRLERLIERALRDSEETISIDLVAIGETQEKSRPTIFVTCSSVAKVKAILARRFRYDEQIFDLKVRRGKVRRSKMSRSSRRVHPPHRSMQNDENYNADIAVMNPYHQQRPLCGASIGAFNGEHLPPVSYGGVILVDDEPVGMTVHHLLDAPSDDESDAGDELSSPFPDGPTLSSATSNNNPWLMGMGGQPGLELDSDEPAAMWDLELSDDEDAESDDFDDDAESFDLSDSEPESDNDSNLDSPAESIISRATTGDIEGIQPGSRQDIKITQPAIDDVDEDFFPNPDDRDEEHLLSHELGHVHASSGIRRWKRAGIVHEIDWALLKLNETRLQPYNICQGGRRFCIRAMEPDQQEIANKLQSPINRRHYSQEEDEYPNGVASAESLGGMNVHCFGRTTGLQGGMINPAMSSVRIYHRKTFSRSWSVAGGFGMGGDSGAWIVQNGTHQVVGHVLAWCQRNHIAYLCPMEVLLEDIKRTLGAQRIYLPGSLQQTQYATRSTKKIPVAAGTSTSTVDDIDLGIQSLGLGIVDSAVDMRSTLSSGPPSHSSPGVWMRNSRLNFPNGNTTTGGAEEKESLGVLRSRIVKVEERERDGRVEMAVVP